MANWLNQLQSLLGQQGASSTGESSKGSALLPEQRLQLIKPVSHGFPLR